MRLRPALAALSATALLGLAACGGSDDDTAADSPTSSGAAESSTESTESDDVASFCAGAEAAFGTIDSAGEDADPNLLPGLLSQTADQLDDLDPPSEIADSWGALIDTINQAAESLAGVDLNTEEGQQAANEVFAQLQSGESAADQEEVDAYLQANCSAESSSPTS